MKTFIGLLTISLSFVFWVGVSTTSCSDDNEVPPPKTFVLVAGAWQGAWTWKDVKYKLEQAGQKVIVVELPGHGTDNTPPQNISLNAYRDHTVGVIEKVEERIILVGHSMAGMVVSAVAERIPSRIEKVIYIGAFIPANGQSILDLISTDTESQLTPSIRPTEDQLLLDVVREKITEIFCQDGSAAVKKQVVDNFRLEPAIPFADKLQLTGEGFGRVTKHFIHTELDKAIPYNFQKRMVSAAGPVTTHVIKTGHSPHLTHPHDIATLLIKIAF
jgi:pimeloyl-ACP methyl ester carboxylesterase